MTLRETLERAAKNGEPHSRKVLALLAAAELMTDQSCDCPNDDEACSNCQARYAIADFDKE